MASGVLIPALDQHREVSALLIGDPDNGITIEITVAASSRNCGPVLLWRKTSACSIS